MEIIDRRKEKAAAEASATAAPKEPTVLEIVKDRERRAVEALANGDMEALKSVEAECNNPPTTYGEVVEFKKTVRGEVQEWRSVGFLPAFLPMGQANVMMLRAVGKRTDDKVFTADYALPPIWEEGADYAAKAKYRLDTFKSCACDERGRCKFHGEVCPGPGGPGRWLEEDIKRLQKIQSEPMPEAVEELMKVEAARAQNRIVVPGGPMPGRVQ
jgi:hypothetical protein